MFKIAISSEKLYLKIISWGFSGVFEFRLDRLSHLSSLDARNQIISRVKVDNNTSKQTDYKRFQDIDSHLIALLDESKDQCFHDVAVSSGITSFELYELLSAQGVSFQLDISDLYSVFYSSGSGIVKIYDANDGLEKAYVFGVVADKKAKRKYFLSRVLFSLLSKFASNDFSKNEILLFDADVIRLIDEGKVGLVNYDIFKTKVLDKYTYVRCMNILNLNYFPKEIIAEALDNIMLSLKEGGILQVGRTIPSGVNEVSFYRKVAGQAELVSSMNGGSETDFILSSNEQ